MKDANVPYTVSVCFKTPPRDLISEAWRILRAVTAGKELLPDHVERYHRKHVAKWIGAPDSAEGPSSAPDSAEGPSSATPQPLIWSSVTSQPIVGSSASHDVVSTPLQDVQRRNTRAHALRARFARARKHGSLHCSFIVFLICSFVAAFKCAQQPALSTSEFAVLSLEENARPTEEVHVLQ